MQSRKCGSMTKDALPDYLRVKRPEEVREILRKVRSDLERVYGERLRGIYLHGSYARSEARPGSDLDVLAILDTVKSAWEEIQRTSPLCAVLSLEYGVTVSLLFRSEEHWDRADTPLILNVRAEGIAA
jgi:predicted nucleotidyltransferase